MSWDASVKLRRCFARRLRHFSGIQGLSLRHGFVPMQDPASLTFCPVKSNGGSASVFAPDIAGERLEGGVLAGQIIESEGVEKLPSR